MREALALEGGRVIEVCNVAAGPFCAMLLADMGAHDAQHWIDAFRRAGVPCAPINSYSQVLADSQVAHMGWVQPLTLPNGAHTQTFVSPIRVGGRNLPVRLAPPALGEHTDELTSALRAAQ